MKELFVEHRIPETFHRDNRPQFANALFTEFAKEWKFDHNASSPWEPQNNGQSEASVKIIKGLFTNAKC